MTDSTSYSVVMNGEISMGYEPESVIDAFAKLFKITPEKANTIVGSKRVLKKGLDVKVAETYKKKLESIGLEIELVRHEPVVTAADKSLEPEVKSDTKPMGLALEPIQEEKETKEEPSKASMSNTIVCPKCSLEQPQTEQCTGCGVFMHKVRNKETENTDRAINIPKHEQVEQDKRDSYRDSIQLKKLVIPLVVAIFGALLWKFIAVTFEYEFGMIAWLIGGAVGFSAAMIGAKGQASAISCGALVLLAIIAGKYMAIASFQTELVEAMAETIQYDGTELQEFYEEEMNDAKQFSDAVFDNESLRNFMVEHGYSEYDEQESVTDEEIENFKKYDKARLEQMAYSPPGFDDWKQNNLTSRIEDISAFDLVIESLGLIDLLFIFLGVGTAFKLGYGEK